MKLERTRGDTGRKSTERKEKTVGSNVEDRIDQVAQTLVQSMKEHFKKHPRAQATGSAEAKDSGEVLLEFLEEFLHIPGAEKAYAEFSIARGLISRLKDLQEGKSVILRLNSAHKISFEVKRLPDDPMRDLPMNCVLWCGRPPRCCGMLSSPI